MKLIIDIPEQWRDDMVWENFDKVDELCQAILDGDIIPDNATVCDIEQITAEIYEHFMTIDGQVHDKSAIKCMEIIGKYKGDKE